MGASINYVVKQVGGASDFTTFDNDRGGGFAQNDVGRTSKFSSQSPVSLSHARGLSRDDGR